jgi:hypothetical protein
LSPHFSGKRQIVGDGNNDGLLKVYGASTDHHIYQFKWNGTKWDTTDVGDGGDWMQGVAVGDGNNDGELEVYGANRDGHIYQFKWNGTKWDTTDVGGGVGMMKVAVGDGNNDGELEVYGANPDSYIYQFKWNGSNWDKDTVGSGEALMSGVAIGDGNNDGELEVYGASYNYHIYQFKWIGSNWIKTDVGAAGDYMSGVTVGDGNNDGEFEIYGASWTDMIYQFKWNGFSWDKVTVGSGGSMMYGVAIGDGNNDGTLEVYGASYNYHIYQFKWIGSNWIKTDVGAAGDWMQGVTVGDGNNDGRLEVYGANYDSHIYQFRPTMYQNIVFSDTSHNFGNVQQGDSVLWQYLYVKNTGELVLHIDSIISSNTVFSVLNTLPDSVSPGDSIGFSIQFKPPAEEIYQGTLSVYSDDPDDSPVFISLEGTGLQGIKKLSQKPQKFEFSVNTPEKGRAIFRFSVPVRCRIDLKIYDVIGRLITVPASGEYSKGIHNVPFTPNSGGIYFYRLSSMYGDITGKIVIF